jgi:hypothetical protein
VPKPLEVREKELADGVKSFAEDRKKFDKEKWAVYLGLAKVVLTFSGFVGAIWTFYTKQGALIEEKKQKRLAELWKRRSKLFSLLTGNPAALDVVTRLVKSEGTHLHAKAALSGYVPRLDDRGVYVERVDTICALSSRDRNDEKCNVLRNITGSTSRRSEVMNLIEKDFSEVIMLLAKAEDIIASCQEVDNREIAIPSDLLKLAEMLAFEGDCADLRKTRPEFVAAVHAYIQRKSPEGKQAINFISRAIKKETSAWLNMPWTDEHCTSAVKQYEASQRHKEAQKAQKKD